MSGNSSGSLENSTETPGAGPGNGGGGHSDNSQGRSWKRPFQWVVWHADYDRVMLFLGVFGIVATLIYGLVAGIGPGASSQTAADATKTAGTVGTARIVAALIAVAIILGAFAVGAFIGFLFGLPRTLTSSELRANRSAMADLAGGPPPTGGSVGAAEGDKSGGSAPVRAGETAPTSPRERSVYTDVNTNLEQISDWLTKIIVGIGLTQINTVPGRLHGFGQQVAAFFDFGGYAFGVGGGLAALIYGFFFAYVGTRVRLSLVFTTSQRLNDDSATGKDSPSESVLDMDRSTLEAFGRSQSDMSAPRNADTIANAKQAADIPLTSITSNEQLLAWSDAQFQTGNIALAIGGYRDILKSRPADTVVLGKLAAALAANGQQDDAEAILRTIRSFGSDEQTASAQRNVEVTKYRKIMQDGVFRRDGLQPADTLRAGAELLRHDPEQEKDVWFQIWLACANAQQYLMLKDEAFREKAILAVKRTLEIDPQKKKYLASLYDPDKVEQSEDDLTPLFPDPVLHSILLDRAINAPEQG